MSIVFPLVLGTFLSCLCFFLFFFFQAEDGIRDLIVTGVQTCALPISSLEGSWLAARAWLADRARDLLLGETSGGTRVGTLNGGAGREPSPQSDGREIGRASCRERV